jgi:cellulose synthase/poly-beta-1,6-N-acetylglucosamine synthase-like glycosyltransferase
VPEVIHALYGGMPAWGAVVFSVAFVVIVVGMLWNVWLFALSLRLRDGGPDPVDVDGFLWVFLVPALNEEVTIADCLQRLLAMECANRRIVVIDDGSTDATPEMLAGFAHPDLIVLRREPPDAQRGKAAALNHGWRHVSELIADGALGDFDADSTVMVVVDADGRLDPAACRTLSGWFAEPDVGGVQVRVRIYNRRRVLTWCQDVEFGVFAMLYQAARARLGTAGMGGNGQFNRLSALNQLADDGETGVTPGADTGAGSVAGRGRPERGPWRDKLTEDQDLGLRLVEAGWRCGHDNRTSVDQQGLPGLRKLFRQRTRWAQGNLQAMRQLPRMHAVPRSFGARVDLHLWLLQPVLQGIVGVAMATSVLVWATRDVGFLPTNWVMVVVFYLLGFTGVILGCIARSGRGPWSWVRGWLIANVYAAYTWLLWPVLARATFRQLVRRGNWVKTPREALQAEPEEAVVSR